ncbi:GNAT family N-acetyltransferase [Microbacterium sp. Bi128]|uniref:GNAT family N-acetyltransferase n=1 Tax=Microbacterium sp. Bi128 TaxID=2821115 RepID=UPI001E3EED1E|nr:GNAT family N-acetyltransferase [Microbacterium sp. Bi128]
MPLIRPAELTDAQAVERVEIAADALLVALLEPQEWPPAEPAEERFAAPGFLLVAEADDAELAGFVHVTETEGICHLEQLSVAPTHARQGWGRALLEAAKREASTRGHRRMTLRTYADVPWNAPFYATAGFREEQPSTAFHRSLIDAEERLGLNAYGRRVQMVAVLG